MPRWGHALGGDEQGTVFGDGEGLGISITTLKRCADSVSQESRAENRCLGIVTVETDFEGVETGRSKAATVIGDRVEEVATGIVGQTRQAADPGPINLEITRQCSLCEKLDSHLGCGYRNRNGREQQKKRELSVEPCPTSIEEPLELFEHLLLGRGDRSDPEKPARSLGNGAGPAHGAALEVRSGAFAKRSHDRFDVSPPNLE